jgi:hypothetical protein
MILSYLLEHEDRIDITLYGCKEDSIDSLKTFFPGLDKRPVFNVCEQLTNHCIDFLFSKNKFIS